MRDPRIDQVVEAIRREFPGTTVVTARCPDPDARDIECMVYALNAPQELTRRVAQFGLARAYQLWGDEPVPILVDAIDPAQSSLFFGELLAAHVAP